MANLTLSGIDVIIDVNDPFRSDDFLMTTYTIRVSFQEDEFIFEFDIEDAEDVDLTKCHDVEDLFSYIESSEELSEDDWFIIKDAIESEIRQMEV